MALSTSQIKSRTTIFFVLVLIVIIGFIPPVKERLKNFFSFHHSPETAWIKNYEVIEIKSSLDDHLQKAVIYQSTSIEKKPVVISLHTWSDTYSQNDYIHQDIVAKNWNYIHPNFRGANNTFVSCASDYVISDIDDAISYAISNMNADPKRIYIIGVSGGAYATIAMFMKSQYSNARYEAWCPITDLKTWYFETSKMQLEYATDILNCTNSTKTALNDSELAKRSPIQWDIPDRDIEKTRLHIYAGVYDGIRGSVPITHSINLYNKLLEGYNCLDKSLMVSQQDTENLLKLRNQYPTEDDLYLGNRKILLQKKYKGITLTIFDGGHEMLTDIAINQLQ